MNLLPTPMAGLMLTSIAASSGNSSLLCTSIGPLTAAMTVYPDCENVAEPSARLNGDNVACGIVMLFVYLQVGCVYKFMFDDLCKGGPKLRMTLNHCRLHSARPPDRCQARPGRCFGFSATLSSQCSMTDVSTAFISLIQTSSLLIQNVS